MRSDETAPLPAATPWPNLNSRLLGLGVGLPIHPLERLAQFSASDFERFVLEWAHAYLAAATGAYEVQQRGGSGDKGRDIVVWLDPPTVVARRWRLYQCKHYSERLGTDKATVEIGKVLHYTAVGEYSSPIEYWFVTHRGVSRPLQDLLDDPQKLRQFLLDNWDKYCSRGISGKATPLTTSLTTHIEGFDFAIFRAKQPQDLLNEYAQTKYYLRVFGAPLIDRPPPRLPPSTVAAVESRYIAQVLSVIAEEIGKAVGTPTDFSSNPTMTKLFERSRVTFYSAEGLKELARDQMADPAFFDTLLDSFCDGLFHTYTRTGISGLVRLQSTVQAAQSLQLGGHALSDHATPNDREGVCHHLANEERLRWLLP